MLLSHHYPAVYELQQITRTVLVGGGGVVTIHVPPLDLVSTIVVEVGNHCYHQLHYSYLLCNCHEWVNNTHIQLLLLQQHNIAVRIAMFWDHWHQLMRYMPRLC
jgi:hypothetical protein